MADETKDPLRAEIERLAGEWEKEAERFLAWAAGSGRGHAKSEDAFAVRAALSAHAPEPQGWDLAFTEAQAAIGERLRADFERIYTEEAAAMADHERVLARRFVDSISEIASTTAASLRALRASAQGGGK